MLLPQIPVLMCENTFACARTYYAVFAGMARMPSRYIADQ